MSTSQRRRKEAKQRRDQIVAAAREVFWKQGYEKATIPAIAGKAELAPGTIYLYFAGKDALYAELLVEGYRLLYDRLRGGVRGRRSPRAMAEALIDAFFAFAAENPEYFHVIFFLLQREGKGGWEQNLPAEQVERLSGHEGRCLAVAMEVLEAAGLGDPSRRRTTVEAVWSMISGVIFYFNGQEGYPGICARAKRLILQGVFGPGG
jgi:AcrR family transcriptional regulator